MPSRRLFGAKGPDASADEVDAELAGERDDGGEREADDVADAAAHGGDEHAARALERVSARLVEGLLGVEVPRERRVGDRRERDERGGDLTRPGVVEFGLAKASPPTFF